MTKKKKTISEILSGVAESEADKEYTPLQPVFLRPGSQGAIDVQLYADGSCLGNYKSATKVGAGGWGYVVNTFEDGRAAERVSRYGGQARSVTSFEMEATAVLEGILKAKELTKGKPIHLVINTDSLNLIKSLHDIKETLKEREALSEFEKVQNGFLPPKLHNKMRGLDIVLRIADQVYNDPNVKGVSTEWIRSHVLDKYLDEDLPSPRDATSYEERQKYLKFLGNLQADRLATKGSTSAIKRGVEYIQRGLYNKSRNPEGSYHTCTRNLSQIFNNSYASVNIAIDFLATKNDGFVKDEDLINIFAINKTPDLSREDINSVLKNDIGINISQEHLGRLREGDQSITRLIDVKMRINKARESYSKKIGIPIDDHYERNFHDFCKSEHTNWESMFVNSRHVESQKKIKIHKSVRENMGLEAYS